MLHKIIQKLKTKQNDSLTLPEKAYLLRNNLNALYALVEGKISFNQYKKNLQMTELYIKTFRRGTNTSRKT